MKQLIVISILNLLVLTGASQEINYKEKNLTIESSVLNESREITLFHPVENSEKLVALYVLDGNWNYELVKGTIAHWVRWGLMADVVVVSIDNQGVRTRDMTPTPDEARFPGSGAADTFLDFVSAELKPTIDDQFPNIQSSILFGHSFGGLFTLYTLKSNPSLFEGYIAVSPSVWWKDQYMYGDYNWDDLSGRPFVYSSAGTNDRGNTTANNEYVAWLKDQSYDQFIELHSDTFEGEDHFSNVPITLHHGLSKYFPKQKWTELALNTIEEHGLNALEDSVSNWKSEFGIRYDLPGEALLNTSHEAFKSDRFEESKALLLWLVNQLPNDYRPFYYLASFHEEKDPKQSLSYYEQALAVGGMPDRMRIVIERKIEALKS